LRASNGAGPRRGRDHKRLRFGPRPTLIRACLFSSGFPLLLRTLPASLFSYGPSSGVASTPLKGGAQRLKSGAQRLKKESAVSRVLSWAVIPLGCASPRNSSDLPGSACGPHVAAKARFAPLFGLAPGGVCRAADVATRAVRSYRTISPLPAPLARHLGGIFLLHFPWAHAPQALPGTLARWSPDFPPCA
jgi:hypothetical protein